MSATPSNRGRHKSAAPFNTITAADWKTGIAEGRATPNPIQDAIRAKIAQLRRPLPDQTRIRNGPTP